MKFFKLSDNTKAAFKLLAIILLLFGVYKLNCLRKENVLYSANSSVTLDQVQPYLDLRLGGAGSLSMCATDTDDKEIKRQMKKDNYKYSDSYSCMNAVHKADANINALIGLVETTPKMNQELVTLMTRKDDDHMNMEQVKIVKSLTKQFNTLLVPFVDKSGELKSMNEYYDLPER